MIHNIKIYGVEGVSSKTDVEVLRELAKNIYKSSRKLVKETYEEETPEGTYFYDKQHLGKLEEVLYESVEILLHNITYRPQKKELEQIKKELLVGREYYYKMGFISDVINDVLIYNKCDLFTSDFEELEVNENNPVFHAEYIIKNFKRYVNIICRVLKDNELKGRLYI